MRIVEAKKILAELGWIVRRTEGVTFYAEYHLMDRFVTIIPSIDRLGDREELTYSPSVSTKKFVDACQHVAGGKNYFSLITCWEGMSLESPEIAERHFRQASEEVISWAMGQNVDKALENHAAWPPQDMSVTVVSTRHLAALSLQNEEQRLRYYRERFAAGNSLGFRYKDLNGFIDRTDRALALVQKERDQTLGHQENDRW